MQASRTLHPLHSSGQRLHPDPVRITAMAGAVAFNLVVLLLMLRPYQGQLPALPAVQSPPWIIPIPKANPDPPPVIEQIERQKPVVDQATPRPPQPRPQPAPVEPGTSASAVETAMALPPTVDVEAFPSAGETGSVGDVPAATGPLTGAALSVIDGPHPRYPREALLAGREGTVLLLVTVGTDGRARSVAVERSSGHRDLDDAARRQVLRSWRFEPAIRNGQRIEASGTIEVAFQLQ